MRQTTPLLSAPGEFLPDNPFLAPSIGRGNATFGGVGSRGGALQGVTTQEHRSKKSMSKKYGVHVAFLRKLVLERLQGRHVQHLGKFFWDSNFGGLLVRNGQKWPRDGFSPHLGNGGKWPERRGLASQVTLQRNLRCVPVCKMEPFVLVPFFPQFQSHFCRSQSLC